MVKRVQNKINRQDDASSSSYEPLVGTGGRLYDDLSSSSHMGHSNRTWDKENHGVRTGEDKNENVNHNIKEKNHPSSSSPSREIHPRVVCFVGSNPDDLSNCRLFVEKTNKVHDTKNWPPSIPKLKREKNGKGKGGDVASSSEDVMEMYADETDECKLSDPSYQAVPAAPSTCNDVHALGFRFGPTTTTDNVDTNRNKRGGTSDIESIIRDIYPSRHKINYLTSGGFRAVWTVTHLSNDASEEGEDPRVIMKTNQLRRGWGAHYLDQNRRDILISERAGGPIQHSNLLPIHQYCAFSSVVPFATAGVLGDYVTGKLEKEGMLMSAEEQYNLALMAARGLYQAHLYHGGRATHAHADVKPPQFLLFDQPTSSSSSRKSKNKKNATNTMTTVQNSMPIMQINDFNRGKFLTKSIAKNNETCPFQMCHVHHKGSLYRSPEEYMDCADQSDGIDVYSLGGVFYYILSDGEKPWYYTKSYKTGVDAILRGEMPRLPGVEEYRSYGKEISGKFRERSKHPAFAALRDVMRRCWAFEPKDRPSSLQVVQMLEQKWPR